MSSTVEHGGAPSEVPQEPATLDAIPAALRALGWDATAYEWELLQEVAALYAWDEDRTLRDEGEPYGAVPVEAGMKARQHQAAFLRREKANGIERSAMMETLPPRFVIVDEADAPEPRMVCEWVPRVGYCYLDRRRGKADLDGMTGREATPIEAFGFEWAETDGGTVTFHRTTRPVTATYRDGGRRRWQSEIEQFEYPTLKPAAREALGDR